MRGRGWTALHALLWLGAVGVAASAYALPLGVAASLVGAALGLLGGRALARSRVRSAVLPFAAAALTLLAVGVEALLRRWAWPSALLGGSVLYALSEGLPAFLVPLVGLGALEALARRHGTWRVLELGALGTVFAARFAAHRLGFVNRPYGLVDPLVANGFDPLAAFLVLGLALALLLLLALVRRGGRRTFLGLGMLGLLLVGLFLAFPKGRLKSVMELHRVQGEGGKGGKSEGKEAGGEGGRQGREAKGEPEKGSEGLPDTFSDQQSNPSDPPVAVVVFHSDYAPPLGYYYFRETAFSAYNGVRVVQDGTERFDRDVAKVLGPTELRLPLPPWDLAGRLGPKAFKDLDTTVALMAPHAHPFGLVSPAAFRPGGNPDPRRFFNAYEVRSKAFLLPPMSLLDEEAGDPQWSPDLWTHYTEGPSDPRYAELAARIVGELPERLRDKPFARAVAIKLWMDKQGTYSLRTQHAEGPDPVGEFLFGDMTGHCVHFAHAACLLYRAAGLPARVAGGYAVPASYRYGGASLLLRSRNAHAWPEVFLRDAGWMPLDISPAKVLDPPQDPPDQGLQQMLGTMAMQEKPPPEPPPQDKPQTELWAQAKRLLKVLGLLLLALGLLALPVGYGVRLWRRWIPFLCPARRVPRLAYRAALDAAAAAGWRRAFGESREAFAARLGHASPAFQALTALHLRWTLGAPGADPRAVRCRALLKAARRELAQGGEGSRLRRLHPFVWWRVS